MLQKNDMRVCKLRRSIYGLKQASRNWFAKLKTRLVEMGFKQSLVDYSLFTHTTGNKITHLLVYVDGIIITGNNNEVMMMLKKKLQEAFYIKDLGKLRFFLGLELLYLPQGIHISQRKYVLDTLKDYGLLGCKPSTIPMDRTSHIEADDSETLKDPTTYRRLVRKLIYLLITRVDITHAVTSLSQYMQEPRQSHMDAALKVLRFLKGSPGRGLMYRHDNVIKIVAHCDADWAACQKTRRSITGYCVSLGTSLISWKSKKQPVVSRSSAEAEYRSMAHATSEITFIQYFLNEFKVKDTKEAILHCDNVSAIHIANNPIFHERIKHIEIDCHFIREKIQSGSIQLAFIGTINQPADLLTKPLGEKKQLNF